MFGVCVCVRHEACVKQHWRGQVMRLAQNTPHKLVSGSEKMCCAIWGEKRKTCPSTLESLWWKYSTAPLCFDLPFHSSQIACMHRHIHTHTYTHTDSYRHTKNTHFYRHTNICTRKYTTTHTHAYIFTQALRHTQTHKHKHILTDTQTHAHTNTHTHAYIYTQPVRHTHSYTHTHK